MQKKEDKRLLVPLQERLSDEEYRKLREFEREMNNKNYGRFKRKK